MKNVSVIQSTSFVSGCDKGWGVWSVMCLLSSVGHASEREAKLADHQFAYNRMEGVGPVVQHRIITGTYFLSYR